MLDEKLKEWATPQDLEYMEAIEKCGSPEAAARALGKSGGTVRNAMANLKSRAAVKGYSPEHGMTHAVPETHLAKGISTYYGADGKVRGQWVKSSLDDERLQQAREAAFQALAADLPRLPPRPAPSVSWPSLCNVYTLTDCHVGMLAWGQETGADWDLEIAEQTLVDCFAHMIQSSPAAATCIVNELGDFLHYDGWESVTPLHRHLLDADGRFPKMVDVAIRILRRVVDMALDRHLKVVVLLEEGNHDPGASVWLRAMFAAIYENEPRVEVLRSPLPYHAYQHGETMLAFHHGHMKKPAELPLLFAAQFPKVWGSTTKRYAHCGHRHHIEEKEHSGMTVFQHPTLSARDAYAARGGYVADRRVTAVTYHNKYGEVGRNSTTPEMLSSAQPEYL